MGIRRIAAWTLAAATAMAAAVLGGALASAMLREQAEVPGGRQVLAAGDVDVSFSEWGDPSGFPVLLVHGSFAWSQTWDVLAVPLARQGYRVVAPDIPPFGYSSRPAGGDYSRGAQARRILAAADAAGMRRFALVGHSFGAGAAVEAAFIAPDRIAGLVIIGGALSLSDPSGGGALAAAYGTPGLGTALSAATFANPMLTAAGLRSFVHDDKAVTEARADIYRRPLEVRGTSREVAAWIAAGLYADERESLSADRARYRAFSRPALLVWGQEDAVTPPEQARELQSLFPRSRLVELPGVGHIPHLENPPAVWDAVAGFLGGLKKPRLGFAEGDR